MGKRILYIQYTNPTAFPPLEHGSKILADDGWQVRFVGTKSRGDSNALQFADHPNLKLELMSYCPPGIKQKLHYLRYGLWCLWKCFSLRPQIVYASDAWSYPIGLALSYLPWLRVIMHEHDTPSIDGSRINRLIGACRKRLSQRAMLCVCPQPERASAMRESLNPRSLQVVFNCPSRSERLPLGEKFPDELGLWFHGSIVPTQLPLAVVDAMQQCRFPVRLTFAGYETIGHPGYVNELLEHARQLGIGNQVRYAGAIPTRREMYRQASQHHVGLALFAMKFREPMVGASNKPFDYLACGLALLAAQTPEWKGFFIDRGCGLACDSENVESIAQALEQLWSDKQKLKKYVEAGQALLAAEWNYETQFEPVKQAMDAVAL